MVRSTLTILALGLAAAGCNDGDGTRAPDEPGYCHQIELLDVSGYNLDSCDRWEYDERHGYKGAWWCDQYDMSGNGRVSMAEAYRWGKLSRDCDEWHRREPAQPGPGEVPEYGH